MLILDAAKLNKTPSKEYVNSKLLFYTVIAVVFVVTLSIGIVTGYQLGIENHLLSKAQDEYNSYNGHSKLRTLLKENRLSRTVIPTYYKLNLTFSSQSTINNSWINPDYYGIVTIELCVTVDTNEIELHSSSDIDIISVTVITLKLGQKYLFTVGEGIDVGSTSRNHLILKLSDYLEIGSHTELQIHFRASISNNIYGIFNGQRENSTANSLVNIFQAENARLAFPCFDELDLKVPWQITIDHPANTTALSNQKAISMIKLDEDTLRTEFDLTKPMSTYLVSLAILSDFSKLCKNSKSEVEVCIWYSNYNESFVQQFLNTTELIFQICEEFLGTKYDYNKFDIIIVDRYFSGGFEGWGLTIMRRDVLTSWKDNLITHEVIHQWIGNQVTASDWGEVWLNEGVTTYLTAIMENMNIADNGSFVFNYTGREERSLFLNKYYGMENVFNSMQGSVFNPAGGSLTGEYTLSPIVYGKPAAILYMLEGIIGREKLWKVIKNLVLKHKYRTVNTRDFLKELEEVTASINYGVNLKDFVETWLLQIGFPVLKVEVHNKTHYSVTQMPLPDTSFHEVTHQIWPIPLWYQQNDQQRHMKWMFEKQIFHPRGQHDDISLLNPKLQGYYHVMYEKTTESSTEKSASEGNRYVQVYNAEHKVVCEELKRMPDIKKFC